jgi:hypothetical protein
MMDDAEARQDRTLISPDDAGQPAADADEVIVAEVVEARADDDVAADQEPAAAAPADAGVQGNGMAGDPEQLQAQWSVIQASFVDDPRGSVTAAAELVTETIGTLVASAQERERGLRDEWQREGIDTEGLRNALRSYRRFLDQLAAR